MLLARCAQRNVLLWVCKFKFGPLKPEIWDLICLQQSFPEHVLKLLIRRLLLVFETKNNVTEGPEAERAPFANVLRVLRHFYVCYSLEETRVGLP